MAAFGFTSTNANIKIGGISTWKLQSPGDTTSNSSIDLGALADGKVVVSALVQKTSKAQSLPYGADVQISAKVLSTHKGTVLELLGAVYGPAQHELLLSNGMYLAALSANTLGLGWKFDSSADYDGMRFVEVTAKGKILLTGTDFDLDDLFAATSVIGIVGPEGALATWSAVGYYPAGMQSFKIRNAGETNFETLGLFRGGKLVCETLEAIDNHGRNIPYAVKFSVEAEMMQSSITELELLDTVSGGSPDFEATLADGAVYTFNNNCGVSWSYHNETDADGLAFIRIAGDGVVALADYAALVA